jgi:HD-GYP domain-containing protein (c-di-GMP phosphodiesterase class II)
MKISKVALILVNKNNQITKTRVDGFEISDSSIRKVVNLCRAKKTVVADELEDESKEKEFLRELDIAVVLPLVSEDSIEGVLVLGDKKSGDMFTAQDLQFLEVLAPEVAIAIKNTLLFEERNKRVLELSALNKLAFSLGSNLDLKSILNQAIEQAILVTEADSGSIMLLDKKSQTLTIEASKGIKREILEKTKIKLGEGIAGWVAKKKEPLIIVNGLDPRFQKELKREDIISSLTVPLKAKEKVIGVLNVNRKTSEEIFSKDDLEVVTTFAAQVAVAIENARLYKNLQRTFLGTISALAAAVDAKDHYTFGHSRNVTEFAVDTAKELSLSQSQVETIRIASTLHDIGKIGIDGSILNKPGKLDLKEREIINLHPTIAANILKSLEFLKDVVPLILFHHERFDGTGYPTKISGHAIPIGARIIAVADAFNAMISERPYRAAMTQEQAVKELKDNSGTQFDPQVVNAFLKVLDKTELLVESKSRQYIKPPPRRIYSKVK